MERMEIEEAREALLQELVPVRDFEVLPLSLAAGRVLAGEVRAPFPVPHFPKSAMDGYAVRSADVADASKEHPVKLRVIREILAGDVPADALSGSSADVLSGSSADVLSGSSADAGSDSWAGSSKAAGTAVRIMTGACVPAGYDAVVRQEDTDYGQEEVLIDKSVPPYMNYCKVGEDIQKDRVVLYAGRRIGRVESGMLASLGFAEVKVIRPLRVTLIATGGELFEPGAGSGRTGEAAGASVANEAAGASAPPAGKIYASSSYALEAALSSGSFTVEHSICPDDTGAIASALEKAVESADIVITTGGVSVGKKDLLPEALERIGARRIFAGVNVQPGTPTIGSVKNKVPILSLSGNPYAALVNFDLYFWAAAAKLTGCRAFLPEVCEAVLEENYTKKNGLRRMIRANEKNGRVSLPAKSHASSVLSNLLSCNCYIDMPERLSPARGDIVRIIRMPIL